MKKALLISFLISLNGCAVTSNEENSLVTCEIIRSGLVGNDTLIGQSHDSRTTSGIVQDHAGINITELTTKIPLELNASFGIEYTFDGLKFGENIIQKITHPEMIKPDGSRSTGFTMERQPGVGVSYILNRSYELVPGNWLFEFFYDENKVCEQSFEVYEV